MQRRKEYLSNRHSPADDVTLLTKGLNGLIFKNVIEWDDGTLEVDNFNFNVNLRICVGDEVHGKLFFFLD